MADDRDRALADILASLLLGRNPRVATITDRARQLDLRLPDRLDLLVVAGPVTPHEWRRGVNGLLVGVVDGFGVALDAAGDPARLAVPTDLHQPTCRMSGHRPQDLPRAFRVATTALPYVARTGRRGVVRFTDADAEVLAAVTGHRDADPASAATLILGGLEGAPHLREALGALLATGSATGAAARLRLHPQSLRYRLARIVEATGRDPRDPWERFHFQAATLMEPLIT